MKLLPLLVPAGVDTSVQFNDSQLFAGKSTFTFSKATDTVGVKTLSFAAHSTLPTAVVGLCARLTSDNRLYYAK